MSEPVCSAAACGFVMIDGVRLESRHVGPPPGAAPTLVLLHEGLGCVGLWGDLPDRLVAATGFGVFAYSRQGYGRSDPVPLPRPLDYHAIEAVQVLPRLLDAIGFRAGILVGHSDGATIAALHAARMADPRVRGIVLIAPHFFLEPETVEGIRRAHERFYSGDLRLRLARWHGANVDGAFHGWCDSWLSPAFAAFDIRPEIAGIGVPLLVVQSERDPYATLAQVEAVVIGARVPVKTLILPGTSHAPHIGPDSPVVGAIAAFARRCLGGWRRRDDSADATDRDQIIYGSEKLASLCEPDRAPLPRPSREGIHYAAEVPPFEEPVELLPGLWWLRLRLPLRLDHVNVWLAADDPGWTIVDTGFDTPETRLAWERALAGLLADRPVWRILATHYHPDHIGLAGWLAARTGAELWTTRTEWLLARLLSLDTSEEFTRAYETWDRRAGLPEELILERRRAGNLYRERASPPPGSYHRLVDGDRLRLAGRDFQVVVGEGHAPEMITLVTPERDLVIAADQLLPRISPVIAVSPSTPDADPLGLFLASLKRWRDVPADALVLPSHGRPYRNLPARLDQLAQHHEERLARSLEACVDPATVYEIMPALFDLPIGPGQLGFALGETYAHLNHLLERGMVERWLGEDGAWRFRAR